MILSTPLPKELELFLISKLLILRKETFDTLRTFQNQSKQPNFLFIANKEYSNEILYNESLKS